MGKGREQTFLQRGYTNEQQAYEKIVNITNNQRNANQNHKKYHFTPIRMATIKKQNNKC